MALRAFGQAILPDIAERVRRAAPVGQFVVQFDAVPFDRAVDPRLVSGSVVLGTATGLGGQDDGFGSIASFRAHYSASLEAKDRTYPILIRCTSRKGGSLIPQR